MTVRALRPVPDRPALRQDLRLEVVDAEHVLLLGEGAPQLFTGAVFPQLTQALDGRPADAVVAALAPDVVAAEAYYALGLLADAGVLVPGPPSGAASDAQPGAPSVPCGTAAFWNSFGVGATAAEDRLGAARVELSTVGSADGAALRTALSAAGLRIEAGGQDLAVVLTDHYLHPALAEHNAAALATARPWVLVRLVGATCWVGPLFRPGGGACWRCLAERLRRNRQVEDFVMRHRGYLAPPVPPAAPLPSLVRAGAALAATQAAQALVTGACALDGQLLTLDGLSLATEHHPVVRHPQCEACGSPGPHPGPRVRLRAAPKPAPRAADGAADGIERHRQRSPEKTYEVLQRHLSPVTGVVTALVELQHEEGVSSVYAAGHNFAMGPDTAYWLRKSLRAHTGGKGVTRAQARMSAMGEAIERYVGVWRGDEPAVRASFEQLRDRAVQPDDLLHFSDRQYAERDVLNREAAGGYQLVPRRFDEHAAIDWTPMWSLRDERPRLVPSSFAYFGHPDAARHFFCTGDSNGCASGSTVEEAIGQAFAEVVERDAVALWWYNRVPRPGVDLASFGLPMLERTVAYHARLQRRLWALDLTSDLGVATFAAVSARTDSPVQDIVFGFGSHLDPRVALVRAVSEANQFLPAVTARDAQGNTRYSWPEDDAIRWWRSATSADHPYLVADPAVAERRLADFPDRSTDDLRDDVRVYVEAAAARGLDTLVLDQSTPDIELAVCRVVVPGMRHFWRRLGPGRLYDVPVELGWLSRPRLEAELNPAVMFV